MKLRLFPVIVTAAVSAAVLFGGWFTYQSVAKEDPFIQQAMEVDGVLDIALETSREKTQVEVKIESGANLRDVYSSISAIGEDIFGKGKVTLRVTGNSSKALEDWWSQSLFEVAQAMETKKYADIPTRLNELAEGSGVHASAEMDENYVYITLTDGSEHKYVVLPRTPVMIGVWPNE